jgi:hypothetical protein
MPSFLEDIHQAVDIGVAGVITALFRVDGITWATPPQNLPGYQATAYIGWVPGHHLWDMRDIFRCTPVNNMIRAGTLGTG